MSNDLIIDKLTPKYISEECLGIKYTNSISTDWPVSSVSNAGTLGDYYDKNFKGTGTLFSSVPKKENIKNYNDLLKALYWCLIDPKDDYKSNRYTFENLEQLLTRFAFYLRHFISIINTEKNLLYKGWVDGLVNVTIKQKRLGDSKFAPTTQKKTSGCAQSVVNILTKLSIEVNKWRAELRKQKKESLNRSVYPPSRKAVSGVSSNTGLSKSRQNVSKGEPFDKESSDKNQNTKKKQKNGTKNINPKNNNKSDLRNSKVSSKSNMCTYRYENNLENGECSIELPANATVLDFKKLLFKIYTQKGYALDEDFSQGYGTVTIIFAGKDLLNEIVLKNLNIGEDTALSVYIRENKDIFLKTAKALQFDQHAVEDSSDN